MRPQALTFQCVLEAYGDLLRIQNGRKEGSGFDMTGEQLLNYTGKVAENAIYAPIRFPGFWRMVFNPRRWRAAGVGMVIGATIGILIGLLLAGRL